MYQVVSCNYCHAPDKDNPRRSDYVSDAKPEKEITRRMMLMTQDLNKKYLHMDDLKKSDTLLTAVITCKTCHRGNTKVVTP